MLDLPIRYHATFSRDPIPTLVAGTLVWPCEGLPARQWILVTSREDAVILVHPDLEAQARARVQPQTRPMIGLNHLKVSR